MQSNRISLLGSMIDRWNALPPTRCGEAAPDQRVGVNTLHLDPISTAKLTPRMWDWNASPSSIPSDMDSLRLGCRVTLWLARIAESADFSHPLYEFLSAEERSRHARFQRAEDRKRYLIGRGLLRRLLSDQLGEAPQCLTLRTGPHGKPFIEPAARHAPLHFNVSHSGDYVLIALSSTHEVGVDIEQQVPDRELPAIAARVFAEADYQTWSRLPAEKQEAAFYQLWTRHEAGLKALGLGFISETHPQSTIHLTWFDLELPTGYAGSLSINSIHSHPTGEAKK